MNWLFELEKGRPHECLTIGHGQLGARVSVAQFTDVVDWRCRFGRLQNVIVLHNVGTIVRVDHFGFAETRSIIVEITRVVVVVTSCAFEFHASVKHSTTISSILFVRIVVASWTTTTACDAFRLRCRWWRVCHALLATVVRVRVVVVPTTQFELTHVVGRQRLTNFRVKCACCRWCQVSCLYWCCCRWGSLLWGSRLLTATTLEKSSGFCN